MPISTTALLTTAGKKISTAKYYGKTIYGTRKPAYEMTSYDTVGYCHIRMIPKNPIDTWTEDSPFTADGWNVVYPDYKISDERLIVSLGTLAAGKYVIKAQRSNMSDAACFDVFVSDSLVATTGSVTDKDIRLEFTLSASSEVSVKLISYRTATGTTGGCSLSGLSITTTATEPLTYEFPYYIEMPYTMAGISVSTSNTLKTYVSSVDSKTYIADTCEYDGTHSYLKQRIGVTVISNESNMELVETSDNDSYVVKCKIPNMKEIASTDYDSISCNCLPTGYVDDSHDATECIQVLGKYAYFRILKSRFSENADIDEIRKFFRLHSMRIEYVLDNPIITDLAIHLFHMGFTDFRTYKNGTLVETDEDTNNGLSLEFELT